VTQSLSGTVAAASEQASANVQSVATATDEMTASIDEIQPAGDGVEPHPAGAADRRPP
jgi:methyl-accepting chemotaxis protein